MNKIEKSPFFFLDSTSSFFRSSNRFEFLFPTTALGRRFYCSQQQKKQMKLTLIINGVYGDIASCVRREINSKDWKKIQVNSIGLCRKKREEELPFKFEEIVELPENDFVESDKLLEKISPLLKLSGANANRHFLFVNGVGGGSPGENQTLDHVNRKIALAFAAAAKKIAEKHSLKDKTTLVQMSSIAAFLKNDEYGKAKKAAEEEITALADDLNVLCLRIGLVLDPSDNKKLRPRRPESHAYSPEIDLPWLPLQPILEDGNQRLQPIHINDIAEGIINAVHFKYSNRDNPPNNYLPCIIDAVGSETITVSQLLEKSCNFFKKKYYPFSISMKDFKLIAKYFPHGHLAPYAAEILNNMPELKHKPFEKLLKKKIKQIDKMFSEIEKENLVRPPLFIHGGKIGRKMLGFTTRRLKKYTSFSPNNLIDEEEKAVLEECSAYRVLFSLLTRYIRECFNSKEQYDAKD